MARVLAAMGLRCGHEDLFNQNSTQGRLPLPWPDDMPGESSWFAVPFLEALPAGTLVAHQVRHPLGVVNSSVRNKFFERARWDRASLDEKRYRQYLVYSFMEHHIRGMHNGSDVEKAMRYWLEWNRLAERAENIQGLRYIRYRLEDIGARLEFLLDAIGLPYDKARIPEVLAQFPKNYNTRGPVEPGEEVTWDKLPPGQLTEEVKAQARRYGYETPDSAPAGM
jgi:hypothetical protein